jgi:cytoskeletal protein CcmA (bactofilin family)
VPPPLVLRAEDEFTGLVVLLDPARIDGRVRGRVVAEGLVWIGESGRICASVEADEVVVAGHIEGQVTARSRVEVLPGGSIIGGLQTPVLTVADGSTLEGPCRTGPRRAENDPASP